MSNNPIAPPQPPPSGPGKPRNPEPVPADEPQESGSKR